MQNIYKILSLLLDYPNEDVKENLSGIKAVIEEENVLDKTQCNLLSQFLGPIQSITLSDWQMLYVQQFDFSSSTNLYLFDHVYGDSRERGQAMVDLTEMYNKAGFMPCSDELPDYLPLFLEYLSLLQNEEESLKLLKEVSHILENMHKALQKKGTPYSYLLELLCSLCNEDKYDIKQEKGIEV
ncbi:Nitrate reductase molybdenum cofactor assembly chaperone NarJ [bioreactor metagenome]|uniref:Nitrate reductase molybdenum cofactor assembly chaperone NarJ n=1 Tax=bioreactor metagenome TaxID=1076179 RepID=A0A644VGH6_9ZZZZ